MSQHYTNISSLNRRIRVFIGLALVLVGFFALRSTVLGDSLMALSLPFLVTGSSGYCPIVSVFHHAAHHHHAKAKA